MHNDTTATKAQARKVLRALNTTINSIELLGEAEFVKNLQGQLYFDIAHSVASLRAELASMAGDTQKYTKLWRPDPMPRVLYLSLKALSAHAERENIRLGAQWRAERIRCEKETSPEVH